MILVISRFRVTNGMEHAVTDAFLQRPRLVEPARGFLGLEVFTDTRDTSAFYLLTRWADEESFRAWHSGDAHDLSRQGIPEGLQFDKTFSRVLFLRRLESRGPSPSLEEITADASPLLSRFVATSRSVHYYLAATGGTIQVCNAGAAAGLKFPPSEIVGQPIWDFLTETDAGHLREKVAKAHRSPEESFLINFVAANRAPYTLQCRLDVQPGWFLLIGESPRQDIEAFQQESLQLNNQLAVLNRENSRKSKELEKARAELEKALDDLRTSYWHLRKLQEVLPICMQCGKIKSESRWEDVVEYLSQNGLLVSHGYCPECTTRLMAEWGLKDKE